MFGTEPYKYAIPDGFLVCSFSLAIAGAPSVTDF